MPLYAENLGFPVVAHAGEERMRVMSTIVCAGLLALSVAALATPTLAQGGDSNPAMGSDIYNLDRGGDYPAWGAPGGVVPPGERRREMRLAPRRRPPR